MVNDPNFEVGERCRALRREQKLTLAALARVVGLSKGHLSRFERGEKTLSLAALLRIAEALDVSVGTLCDGADPSGELTISHAGGTKPTPMSDEPTAATYRVLGGSGRHQTLLISIPAHCKTPEPAQHAGRESLYVLSGSILLSIDGDHHPLNAGDYAEFDARSPHVLTGKEEPSEVLLTSIPD
ncbi:helix-turn-helix domain-containing protein [Tritonibacter scottomollicae]|uniref:helix-turn-helix domain-containing protein n=1 Tax=Tritonibacter scottomollicae TaxID=483013 RepID=UPI003AA90807